EGGMVSEATALEMAMGHEGFGWVEVEVLGRAAHGSRPAEGQDAILRLGRVLAWLEALDRNLQQRPPHHLMGTASLHASFIEGGHELHSYPDRALLTLERRTLPDEPESPAPDDLRHIPAAVASEGETS